MSTQEEIVKWLLGIFAFLISVCVGLVINAIRDLRKKVSDNTKDLHMKIDANAKEFRDGYVRTSEMREVKDVLRDLNGNVAALTRALIKNGLHIDPKG